jgi:ubiquinone/menaquinone biosynthesis C-methylase UbiE
VSIELLSKETVSEQYKSSSNLDARIRLHERFSINRYGFPQWIFDQLELPPDAAILDLGCGMGGIWRLNAVRIPPGWRITLADFSPALLAKARQNTQKLNGWFGYALADIANIPFEDQSFDAVIANHVLFYLATHDRARGFSGIQRALKKGGRFYASTNGSNHMQELVKLVEKFDASIPFLAPIHKNFSLETGVGQVAEWLSEVEVLRYDDGLVVDEAEALIQFILSASTVFSLPADRKATLSDFIREWMAEHDGVIKIRKDSGLIRAKR